MMHQARNGSSSYTDRASYRYGRHWSSGDEAVQHPGRLADCALCLTAPDEPPEVVDLY